VHGILLGWRRQLEGGAADPAHDGRAPVNGTVEQPVVQTT
jgi:hypothetical protein